MEESREPVCTRRVRIYLCLPQHRDKHFGVSEDGTHLEAIDGLGKVLGRSGEVELQTMVKKYVSPNGLVGEL